MKFILIIIFLIPVKSFALFDKLYLGYIHSNRIKEIELSADFTEQNYIIGKNKYSFELGINGAQSESGLQSLLVFNSNETKTTTKGISLSKSSYKFGTLTFEHKQLSYDISKWSSSSLTSYESDQLYESKNTITYQYNFFNKDRIVDWEVNELQFKSSQIKDKELVDTDRMNFFNSYLGAKLRVFLDRLYKENKKKSEQRVSLLQKRVKDGLSRSVDLNQAYLSLYNQEELILKNYSELRHNIASIEEIIKVNISEKDYKDLGWSFKRKEQFNFIKMPSEFNETKYLELTNLLNQKRVEIEKTLDSHKLYLNLSYSKNNYATDQSESLSDVFDASGGEEKIVSLQYTIPLGMNKRRALKNKLLLQEQLSKLNLDNRKGQLMVDAKVYIENIERYEEAIKLNDKKIKVSERIVDENQRLYLRGQASFEEVLRADENLINTKISKINMLYLYESTISKLAFLNNDIKTFLQTYKD